MAKDKDVADTFSVKLGGFKTQKQAMAFLEWYEGGGEQYFYDHLDIIGLSVDDGCNIDVNRRGNSVRGKRASYYDINGNEIYAEVK